MIAFGKDHQGRWCSDPADNVRHCVRVTGERSNTGLQLRHDWPHERFKWCQDDPLLFCGGCSVRLLASEGNRAQSGAKKCAPLHHVKASWSEPLRSIGSLARRTFALTGRRSAKRYGDPTAPLLGAPVECGVMRLFA